METQNIFTRVLALIDRGLTIMADSLSGDLFRAARENSAGAETTWQNDRQNVMTDFGNIVGDFRRAFDSLTPSYGK